MYLWGGLQRSWLGAGLLCHQRSWEFLTKVRDFTGHRGFPPGTPASSLPPNNTGCSQFNFKNKKNLFSFPFPNSDLPAFTPRVCTVYCCPCCVSVICLLHVSVYVGIDRRALSLNLIRSKARINIRIIIIIIKLY